MESTYKKKKGSSGAEGVRFQLDLLTVFALNALRKHKVWKISTENEQAGKYDDLVLELSDKNVFLQAKFKQSKIITREQLLSTNFKNSDFSLPKYFFSYLEIRSETKDATVIICTNTDINQKDLEGHLTFHTVAPDSLLYYEGAKCPYLTFNETILSDLGTSAEAYLDNLKSKKFDKAKITDENMKEFLRNLQFVYNYPSKEELRQVIEGLLCSLGSLWSRTTYHEIYRKVEEWFEQPKGEYLTAARVNAMLCEIRSEQYCNSLKNYNVSFESNDLEFLNSNRIIHIKTEGGYLLQMLKILQALPGDNVKQLYMNPDEDIEMQKYIVEAFGLPRYVFLILVWSNIRDSTVKMEISSKVRETLEECRYKKIVLLTEDQVEVAQEIGLTDVSQVNGSVKFQDFAEHFREVLLKNKNIVFQGDRVSLEELLEGQITEDYMKSLDSRTLEKFVRGQDITVGERLLDLDDDIARYYVHRTFESEPDGKGRREDAIPEENIFDITENVVLISDSAGMGKTTVLTKMATHIKQRNCRMWVIKMNLVDYTRILRDYLRNERNTITLAELMNSQEATKFKNRFEEFLFSIHGKVVLMLDGVDEIAPKYTQIIVHLLRQCQEAANIAKLYATTRPHMTYELKVVLKMKKSFTMLPFTKEDQTEFLINYWTYNLQLEYIDERARKCAQYAKMLIAKMSSWTGSQNYVNSIGAIPLQISMVASIFQEKNTWKSNDWESCIEFLEGTEKEPNLPKKFDITKLYDMFINKKRDVFIDRGNPTGNATADQVFMDQFEACLADHRSLALELILTGSECNLFSTYQKGDSRRVLQIGIVQRNGDTLSFVHRTFAEYFVATSILQELQLNSSVEFQQFLIDHILVQDEFKVIRGFLDNYLDDVVASLSSDIFTKYQSQICKVKRTLISTLAKEGHVGIIRLILKSIKFKIIRGDVGVLTLRPKIVSNTLSHLQWITRTLGINFDNESGNTPLHYAADGCHFKMVKFLIDHGADVNIENIYNRTSLHAAITAKCELNIVQCLVENGTNINARDSSGSTALHYASSRGALDIVRYLVECGAIVNDRDNRDNTALHWAARRGVLDNFMYLVERGAIINDRDNKGRTALHWAAEEGRVDIIEYIVKRGENINDKCNDGRTALHWASEGGERDAIKYIVKCGASVNDRDNNGRTALHWAVKGSLINISRMAGRVNASDDDMDSPAVIRRFAKNFHLDAIKYIVDCGANVNAKDNAGRTILHTAVMCEENVIKYLVECGVNVNERDNDGHTAAQLALEREVFNISQYLNHNLLNTSYAT